MNYNNTTILILILILSYTHTDTRMEFTRRIYLEMGAVIVPIALWFLFTLPLEATIWNTWNKTITIKLNSKIQTPTPTLADEQTETIENALALTKCTANAGLLLIYYGFILLNRVYIIKHRLYRVKVTLYKNQLGRLKPEVVHSLFWCCD